MPPFPEPSEANDYLAAHIQVLRDSYSDYLGKPLVDGGLSPAGAAQQIYHAPFVVVSHNAAADPVFTYGNKTALALFEMTWLEFTQLPSRQSAEPPIQAERDRLLAAVTTQGFISDYAGVRISKGGRRFWIRNVTVWNLRDPQGHYCGQAAVYSDWADV
ncbi:MAG: MEKHLA domain-containing protein [Cyanobacteria bacterium]|nr:MEKHLA domain-containing protein [Cyanobacteriota bacterium]MDA0866993.1 MEKHLA domain-containing protein [Cyanobacteriota bacterium]